LPAREINLEACALESEYIWPLLHENPKSDPNCNTNPSPNDNPIPCTENSLEQI